MAQRDLSRHQEKIVKRYYDQQDTRRVHKLGDLLSELYLADSKAKQDKLWAKAEADLLALGVEAQRVDRAVAGRDLERLGRLIQQVGGN
ncbi:MAG: hypothetical protein AAF288_08575 [Planctomycetota bacterium]